MLLFDTPYLAMQLALTLPLVHIHVPGEQVVSGFTPDPSQLQGEMFHTALRKSSQGFGFTIIGGDRHDEFLQVKNVLSDGPAANDKKIASGE